MPRGERYPDEAPLNCGGEVRLSHWPHKPDKASSTLATRDQFINE